MPGSSGAFVVKRGQPVCDDATRLAILEHLIAGRTIPETAGLVGHHRGRVQMIAGVHGYPNSEWMQQARDRVAERLADPAATAAR